MATPTNVNVLRTLAELRMRQSNNILEVCGFSMEPLIFEKDSVLIEKRPSYNIGDILVVADIDCRLLIHRLIWIEGDILITKGDNAVGVDKSYTSNCLGVAARIYVNGDTSSGREGKQINPYRPFIDGIIVRLSRRMNKKFMKGIPSEKLFAGWERKLIKRLVRIFYRPRK